MPPFTFYISPTGSDSNPGSEAQPWKTIQRAAETLQAGETVLIRAGEYREWVRPQHSGAEGKPITYAAYPGEIVTLNGAQIELPAHTPKAPRPPHPTHDWVGAHIGHPEEIGGLFQIEGRSHIIVKGLRITHAGPHRDNAGILVKDSDNIRIEGNFIYDTTSSGIGVWRSYKIIVTGTEVELACNDGGQECITIAGTDEYEVSYNHVHHNGPGSIGGEGIDSKHGSSNGRVHHNHIHHINRLGIYVDAWNTLTQHIAIYQNIVHDNAGDGITCAAEAGGLLESITIYNNLIFRNGRTGVVIGWYGMADHQPISNVNIFHNTIYHNGANHGGGVWLDNPEAVNILVQNNIVSQNGFWQIALRDDIPTATATFHNNLTFGFRDHPDEIQNPLHTDPKFVNDKMGNFRPRSDSPALQAGLSLDYVTVDFNDQPRPVQNPDIGAYQFQHSPIQQWEGVQGAANLRQTFPLQGFLRDYYVHLPQGKLPSAPAPLVLFLHGLESEASQLHSFDHLSDRFGFVAVYPNSVPTDNHAWNVGAELNPHVDDIAFFDTLLDILITDYNIDPRRIYASGHSNGGAMTLRLACELADRFAAFASSAGLLVRAIAEKAQRPVPIFHIHGDADPTVPWEGWTGRFSVMEQAAFWAQKNGCNQRPFRDLYRHKDLNGPLFERYEYYSYPLDIDEFPKVMLLRARGGGHDWFGSHQGYDIDANVEFWRFFQNFIL